MNITLSGVHWKQERAWLRWLHSLQAWLLKPIFKVIRNDIVTLIATRHTIASSWTFRTQLYCSYLAHRGYTKLKKYIGERDTKESKQRKKKYWIRRSTLQIICWSQVPTKRSTSARNSKRKVRVIPWRRRPVVQRRGHRVQGLQAEPKEQGRQKLDNQ